MKKFQFLILCTLAVAAISCGSGKNPKAAAEASGTEAQNNVEGVAAVGNSVDGKYELFYNFELGKTYTQSFSADMNIAQNIMGQSMDIATTMDMKINFLVADVTNDVFTFDVSYQSMAMSMDTPMGSFSFNSDESDPNSPLALMSDLFAAMKSSTFRLTMTKYGELREVTGLMEMFENAFLSLDLPESEIAAAKASMMQEFNEEKFLDQMKNMTLFPDHPIDIGESWTIDVSMAQMDIQNTYTLKAVTDTEVVLDIQSTISNLTMPGATGMLSGEQWGTTTLHRSSGWIKHSEMEQHMSGTVSMQGMESQIEMISKITIGE